MGTYLSEEYISADYDTIEKLLKKENDLIKEEFNRPEKIRELFDMKYKSGAVTLKQLSELFECSKSTASRLITEYRSAKRYDLITAYMTAIVFGDSIDNAFQIMHWAGYPIRSSLTFEGVRLRCILIAFYKNEYNPSLSYKAKKEWVNTQVKSFNMSPLKKIKTI